MATTRTAATMRGHRRASTLFHSTDLYQLIRNCMIVRNLRTTVESSLTPLKTTDYRKVLLLRKSHRVEYHNCTCVSVYTEGVMKLVARRADIGKNVEDDEAADMLLSSLPEIVLVSGLETAGFTNTLTIEIVYAFPLQEDHRMSNVQTDYDISSAYLIKEKITKLLCSCCKRNGKAARRCFVKRKREGAIANTEDKEDNALCAAANLACPCQDVIVARGAIVLLASSHEVLQEYNKKAYLISVASGELLIGELYEHDVPSSCVPCFTGKMSVTSVPRLCIGCAAKPLELTHSDLLTRCKSALGMEPASC
ncbi:uncharacterized protein LOC134677372 [Cydia fagiglandana]|uniref:uncharacterized protein LOC134666806 n=1 Tax=Cydia fagiglandana TaxID=1458189 RepID=UPI002FEE38EC